MEYSTDSSNPSEQLRQGGDYEANRELLGREQARRTRIILAMHAVNEAYLVPVDPSEETNCESCQ